MASDDWFEPRDEERPKYRDYPPEIPRGSHYSPKRNRWRLPDGREVDAGRYRPVRIKYR